MPRVTQQRTRKQVRQSVGTTLGAINQDDGAIESTPSQASGNAGEIVDDALAFGGADEFRGHWVVASNSASPPTVDIRRLSGSSPEARTLTPAVAFTSTPNTSWTYELWSPDVPPTLVHDFINQ